MDPQTDLYLEYYKQQSGGQLTHFAGTRRGQYGNGIGDMLSGNLRSLIPIVGLGALTYLGSLFYNRAGVGMDWKTAAKKAVTPAVQSVVVPTLDTVLKSNEQQEGKGGRRKRRIPRRKLPAISVKAYKRKHSKQGHAKRRHSKRIKFINF